MSKADELLRDLIAAWDEDRGIVCAVKAGRAYLNEKPHEPPRRTLGCMTQAECDDPSECEQTGKCQRITRAASPPHAEPEKPMDTDQVNAAYAAYFNAHPPASEPEKPMDDDLPGMLAVAKGVAEQKWRTRWTLRYGRVSGLRERRIIPTLRLMKAQ